MTTENETKAEKFVRLANFRYGKVAEAMHHMYNLANTNTYEYTDEQVQRLVDAMYDEIIALKKAFTDKKKPTSAGPL